MTFGRTLNKALKSANLPTDFKKWSDIAQDRLKWRERLRHGVETGVKKREERGEEEGGEGGKGEPKQRASVAPPTNYSNSYHKSSDILPNIFQPI